MQKKQHSASPDRLSEIQGLQNDSVDAVKANLGVLRRAFSSIKKRKKKTADASTKSSPLRNNGHLAVRVVHSSPIDYGCSYFSSPTSDLAARRGVFSRRHYGSVELLTSLDSDGCQQNAGRFRVESGDRADCDEVFFNTQGTNSLNSLIHLENPEFQTRWYFKYFLGKLHQNYVGTDSEKEPFLLSVVVTDANNHNVPQYRAILWRKTGAKKICLPYNPNKPQTVKGILSHFDLNKLDRGPREIFDPHIQKEHLVLEEQEGSVNFKIGVLFAKEGQSSDDEFYSNEDGNENFHRFVSLLGDEVSLKGWDKFKAGLDVKSNTTGEHSVYTVYEGHEIMFHVSTLLPYSKNNKQQVERKRHIGNDIVNIVFVDCDTDKTPTFKPSMMKTRFTHIFLVVTYSKENDWYRLQVFSEESVPLFGPPLPSPPLFTDHDAFRDFLLVKAINGEKAAVNNPMFGQKRERTLEMLIKNIYQDYMSDTNKTNMLYRRAFSDVIQDTLGSRRKEEARRAEFVLVGQALKVKTIEKGDAPTSLINTGLSGLLRREPWEPQKCYTEFPHLIFCGDSWGDKLVLSTDSGTLVLEEGLQPRTIIDKSVTVKQLSVVEIHGLLILRTDKGKDSRINVIRLADFEGEHNETTARTKADLKDHKLERTKGCLLYAINKPGGSHLRLVVSMGKRLLLFTWKHSAAWSAWCPTLDHDTTDGFTFVRELQTFETPQLITLIDGMRGDNQICIGYKNQFDLINEKNGDTLQLYHIDANKVTLVSALDIYEDDEAELILCYNHVSHFQKLKEEQCHDYDFYWNSEPHSIVCAFPYVMAFTPDTIEIRLIINGNLVHTMTMPDLTMITSKCDIYFSSSASRTNTPTEKSREKEQSFSPPPSPSSKTSSGPVVNIYKIPLTCLAGQMSTDKGVPAATGSPPSTLLAPITNNGDRSPGVLKRSPLVRTKRAASSLPSDSKFSYLSIQEKDRHDSSSSDSGITMLRTNEFSPPSSPFNKVSPTVDSEPETDLV
ncbi:GTPase-activating Rap/Ran-GAP domain-like protein 3 isoform X2 [Gigantopelta aegis]|uniref:GTPase-activating Rap/Ran-GAP domain-like protein 3 isoform X2 n=1 Tax=Gigantopelta aegis TaxID=1735272 RepID=UPI001B889A93|nr:GTPase-activating Rap/Ran-GAP domain-like protein 3 isoform X2 [Gigantopelta aegis]